VGAWPVGRMDYDRRYQRRQPFQACEQRRPSLGWSCDGKAGLARRQTVRCEDRRW